MTTTQPVGKVYVSGDGLSDIRILDSETLAEIDRIPTDTNQNYRLVISDYLEEEEMNLVAFSDDSSTRQKSVYIHNSITNERLSQIKNVPGYYGLEILSSSSSFSSLTPIIVSADYSRLCAYNSLTTEKLIDCWNLPFESIHRIKCFPEWNLNEVFIGGRDNGLNGLLHRYDLNQDCVMLGSYVGHVGSENSYVEAITASLTDGILISGSSDDNDPKGTLKLWSKDTFECIESVSLDYGCYSLGYSPDSHLICCGTRREIEIWDIRNMRKRVMLLFNTQNRIRKVLNVGNGAVNDLDSISNSSLFVSGSGGYVSIWNPLTGKVLRKTKVGGRIYGIRFLPSHTNTHQIEIRRIEEEESEEIRLQEERRRVEEEERRVEEEEEQQQRALLDNTSPMPIILLSLDQSCSSFRILSSADVVLTENEVFERSDLILECLFFSQSSPDPISLQSITLFDSNQSIALERDSDIERNDTDPVRFHWNNSIAGTFSMRVNNSMEVEGFLLCVKEDFRPDPNLSSVRIVEPLNDVIVKGDEIKFLVIANDSSFRPVSRIESIQLGDVVVYEREEEGEGEKEMRD